MNTSTKDISGNQYGDLKALYPTTDRSDGSVIWVFVCKCGRKVKRSLRSITYSVYRQRLISCGCRKYEDTINKYKYLIGMSFGKLTVEKLIIDSKTNKVMCLCRCECGNGVKIIPYQLAKGRYSSCSHECRWHNPKLPEGVSNAKQIYLLYRNYARLKGIFFDLTFDQFMEVSQMPCHECGMRPNIVWDSPPEHGRNGSYKHNKVSYIKVSLGYTYNNVIPLCLDHLNKIRVEHRIETQST